VSQEDRERLMSRSFFRADHFGRCWRETDWSRPHDYAAQLTSRGFKVYLYRLAPDDPGYAAWKASRLSTARISWHDDDRDMRAWTEGHGRSDDDAIAMACGRLTLHRERKAAS
jgi:hypothetical protein